MYSFVAARNLSGRPTLMHRVEYGGTGQYTLCGYDMSSWSRAFFAKPVDILLCLRCKKFMALSNNKKVVSIGINQKVVASHLNQQ